MPVIAKLVCKLLADIERTLGGRGTPWPALSPGMLGGPNRAQPGSTDMRRSLVSCPAA